MAATNIMSDVELMRNQAGTLTAQAAVRPRATMAHTKRSDLARASGPHKVRRSPDWSLQLDSMKSESLVIVDQNATVNTFPGLVHTARHTTQTY